MPLLSGEVAVDRFVLVDPVIHLEVDKKGQPNWVFGEAAEAAPAAPTESAGGGVDLGDVRLGDVRLVNGSLSYLDARSGEKQEVEKINMALSLPDLDSPFAAEGEATWRGEKVALVIGVDKPRNLLSGDTTGVKVNVGAKPVTLDYKGSVATGGVLEVKGDIDLDVPSVRGLAAWTGNPIAAPGDNLGPASIKGKLALAGPKISFIDARMAIDAIRAAGELLVDSGGAKPYIKGRLDVEKLDLNPYLPPETTEEKPAKQEDAGPGDWSDDPIDTAGLHAVDADFQLTVGGIVVRKIEIGKGVVKAQLKGGRLAVDLAELSLYGGNGEGTIVLDGSGKVAAIEETFTLSGVQAEPLLRDAAAFERLSGTLAAQIAVTGKGGTQRQIVSSLGGKGAVTFTDGAIEGINIGAMVRNVTTAFLDSGSGTPQKTDFAELSGTYTITKGILSNQDLTLQSPLLRVAGAGTVDLPKRTVDYRVEPKAAFTTEGQGGDKEAAGITVPVIVEGPWHDISYKPDLAGMVKKTIGDPTKVLESVSGALPSLPKPTTGEQETAPANPLGIVKGLFGGTKK